MNHLTDTLEAPLGSLTLTVDALGRLHRLDWSPDPSGPVPHPNPFGLTTRLAEYFAGDLHAIDGIEVAMNGTPFQCKVWSALRGIPCGQTISYGELARRIDNPKAVRAVGLANGSNPISIVVPCHRVIGANGTLTGYGGGLERKRWLLAHERATANMSLSL